ncbi:copper chaperone [Thermoclostridium stercorarium subsp. stercorarium DSM 8532]|jgi:copper chaperone CopZ|uniref:Copper chaperone n=3 Tax=Thermoclostridium stercorarium TaxID=1510 RepID=L7VP37_THES1|nr:cation transporter [Thermoclostridium stercorarium]AGC68201.1 copper chaperone [Thermoclostridium stercorarium subsp. stercorarium DSM 8532]AGI39229.1 copper chaperone [Thermoclostridium stercorarium subsp. stercorarium DSM 8532]ANW98572.1 copper resistance protein CopZ [Thermoclostridium stercorarium subsp. thermolacticum DSM 2910]ANX01110.1 copper resistance protein CopZ [Thermoclostridium stercorarium subsp. leptospartum DSM 9219]UZQ86728.1 cation transporter [Thermoclostridium stercorar
MESQLILTVNALTEDCAQTIKNALIRINGVENVIINIENKKIYIEYDDEKINEKLIRETIEDEGYEVK